MAGIENTPLSDETVLNVSDVATFLTTTSAPGITPPSASTTTPEMDAVDCARTVVAERSAIMNAAAVFERRVVMDSILQCKDRERFDRRDVTQVRGRRQDGCSLSAS